MLDIRDARENDVLFRSVQPVARIDNMYVEDVRERTGFAPFVDEVYAGVGTLW